MPQLRPSTAKEIHELKINIQKIEKKILKEKKKGGILTLLQHEETLTRLC